MNELTANLADVTQAANQTSTPKRQPFLWAANRTENWTRRTQTFGSIPNTRWSASETQHINDEVFPKYSFMRSGALNDLGRGKKDNNAWL